MYTNLGLQYLNVTIGIFIVKDTYATSMGDTLGSGCNKKQHCQLGNILTRTNALGHTTTYGYDAKGRMVSEDIAGLEQYSYRYDTRDRLISVEGENSLVTYTYNWTIVKRVDIIL